MLFAFILNATRKLHVAQWKSVKFGSSTFLARTIIIIIITIYIASGKQLLNLYYCYCFDVISSNNFNKCSLFPAQLERDLVFADEKKAIKFNSLPCFVLHLFAVLKLNCLLFLTLRGGKLFAQNTTIFSNPISSQVLKTEISLIDRRRKFGKKRNKLVYLAARIV